MSRDDKFFTSSPKGTESGLCVLIYFLNNQDNLSWGHSSLKGRPLPFGMEEQAHRW